jgi:hypothetical protein
VATGKRRCGAGGAMWYMGGDGGTHARRIPPPTSATTTPCPCAADCCGYTTFPQCRVPPFWDILPFTNFARFVPVRRSLCTIIANCRLLSFMLRRVGVRTLRRIL